MTTIRSIAARVRVSRGMGGKSGTGHLLRGEDGPRDELDYLRDDRVAVSAESVSVGSSHQSGGNPINCATQREFNEPRGFPFVLGLAWAGGPESVGRMWRNCGFRPAARFASSMSATFLSSPALGVGQDRAALVRVVMFAFRLPDCSQSSAIGVGQASSFGTSATSKFPADGVAQAT
jgi:hypothetical protein